MTTTIFREIFIEPGREGSYFTVPFPIDEEAARLTIRYDYARYDHSEQGMETGIFYSEPEMNIIDLGLIAPDGTQIGASGSDKVEIQVSEAYATPGYTPCRLVSGEWQILVGAYHVAPEGCRVSYEITLEEKRMQLLKGDLHIHTLASDGCLSPAELAQRARRHGMDFLAITDHNQMSTRASLPEVPGVTLIPGVEWTHFRGHASFLGVDKPYDWTFAANTPEEALERFQSARQRGALIIMDHPFEPPWQFQFDLDIFPYDCLEVWNGPMREHNLRALANWQNMLTTGKKIPICGGSDYHCDTPFIFPGGPTTCVHSMSPGVSDILDGVRQGHAYVTFSPKGPSVELTAGDGISGDTVAWSGVKQLHIAANGLEAGDVLRVVTQAGAKVLLQAPTRGRVKLDYSMDKPGFARVEILRVFIPGIPMLPALLSNPIYFED